MFDFFKSLGVARGKIVSSEIDTDRLKFWKEKELRASRMLENLCKKLEKNKDCLNSGTYVFYNKECECWLVIVSANGISLCFSSEQFNNLWGVILFTDFKNGKFHCNNGEFISTDDMAILGWFDKINGVLIEI